MWLRYQCKISKGCSVQFNKILAKHSLVKNFWSLSCFMSFKFILARVNKVSMATNNCLLSFYTLSLKMKLVCHLLFNGHDFFSQASLVILLKKRVFQFLIATPGVELCWDKQKFSQLSKSVSKNIRFIYALFKTWRCYQKLDNPLL